MQIGYQGQGASEKDYKEIRGLGRAVEEGKQTTRLLENYNEDEIRFDTFRDILEWKATQENKHNIRLKVKRSKKLKSEHFTGVVTEKHRNQMINRLVYKELEYECGNGMVRESKATKRTTTTKKKDCEMSVKFVFKNSKLEITKLIDEHSRD